MFTGCDGFSKSSTLSSSFELLRCDRKVTASRQGVDTIYLDLQWKVWFIFLGTLGGKVQNVMQGVFAEEGDGKLVQGSIRNWRSWDIMGECYDVVSKLLQACLNSFFACEVLCDVSTWRSCRVNAGSVQMWILITSSSKGKKLLLKMSRHHKEQLARFKILLANVHSRKHKQERKSHQASLGSCHFIRPN